MTAPAYSWLLNVVSRDVDGADAGGRKLPAHIEHFDVEDGPYGRDVIVTLTWGWSFEPCEHQGVRGFDTITEARRASARKRVYPCDCDECRANMRQATKEEPVASKKDQVRDRRSVTSRRNLDDYLQKPLTPEGTAILNVRIPVSVMQRLRAAAEEEGVTLSEYVRRVLDGEAPAP